MTVTEHPRGDISKVAAAGEARRRQPEERKPESGDRAAHSGAEPILAQIASAGAEGICVAEIRHQLEKQRLGRCLIQAVLAELVTKPGVRRSREKRANRGGWLQEQTVLRYEPSDDD